MIVVVASVAVPFDIMVIHIGSAEHSCVCVCIHECRNAMGGYFVKNIDFSFHE